MKKYNSKKEPYRTLIKNIETVHCETGRIYFSDRDAYYIAKSTGLKSKKTRIIKKRFKKVINQALSDMMRNLDERKSD